MVIVGSVFEEIGNYVEKSWDAEKAKESEPAIENDWVSRDWRTYLSKSFGNSEPVGYRYLSRKVTAMYFELGMMCGIPTALVGATVLVKDISILGSTVIGVFCGNYVADFQQISQGHSCCPMRNTSFIGIE